MSRPRIYIEPQDIEDFIQIGDKDIIHKLSNVLRLKKGDEIIVFDGKGRECNYSIEELGKNCILAKRGIIPSQSKSLGKKITLAFPLTKEDKIDFILQKATELGVAIFIPFSCQRSLQFSPSAKKKQRWQKIITEATRQSQGLWMPALEEATSFKKLIKRNYKLKLAGSFEGKRVEDVLPKKTDEVLVVIGPEGDFTKAEYEQLENSDFKFIRLSSQILRVETACIFSVGLINYIINAS